MMLQQREKLRKSYSQYMAGLWKDIPGLMLLPLLVWWNELSEARKGNSPPLTKTQMWQYIAFGFLALLITPVTLIVMPVLFILFAIRSTGQFAFHYWNAKTDPVVPEAPKANVTKPRNDISNTTPNVSDNASQHAEKSDPKQTFECHFMSRYGLADTSDKSLSKALRMAANSNDVPDIKYLLSAKSYLINWQSPETGKTALHLAVAKGHKKAIEALDELGADRDVEDKEGVTVAAMLLSQRSGGHLSTSFINSYSLQNTSIESLAKAFRMAAYSNHHDDLRVLFRMKPEVIDMQDNNPRKGKTALHLAVEKGHQKSIEVLRELGAKTDICDREHNKTVDELLKEKAEAAPAPALAV